MTTQIAQDRLKPQGIGLAVSIDWALGSQMLSGMVLTLLGIGSVAPRGLAVLGTIAGGLLLAAMCFGWGEGLRSGRMWAWWLQLIVSAVVIVIGLVVLPATFQDIGHGNFWPVWPEFVQLVLFPLNVYRLVQPSTREWFAKVTVRVARSRHNSTKWFATIMIGAAFGGLFVALARVFS